jgi:hypothetical protein
LVYKIKKNLATLPFERLIRMFESDS